MLKRICKIIISSKAIASLSLNLVLKLHSTSYHLSSLMAVSLEKNRIHPKHRLMDYHDWFASKIRDDWSILDVGCGNGALASTLSGHCRKVTAIDISPQNIKTAGEINTRENIEFIVGDATSFEFKDRFDAVILSNVLEHIDARSEFLKKLSGLSDTFLIRVPLMDRDWITLYKAERGVPYMLDKSHYIEYTEALFTEEIGSAGLKISEQRVRYGELYAVCTNNDQLN